MEARGPVVLHVLGRLDIGGAERMLLALSRAMGRTGTAQHVLALSGRSGRLTPAFVAVGVTEHLCGIRPILSFPVRLSRTVRRVRPDVLVSHVSLASAVILALGRLCRVRRRIAVFHSDGDGRPGSVPRRAYRAAMRRLLPWGATHVVGVTSSTLEFSGILRHPRTATVVAPNGVDLQHFVPLDKVMCRQRLGLPVDGLLAMHAGRASPEKNRRALVGIVRALPEPATLVLAGAASRDDLFLEPGDPAEDLIRDFGAVDDIHELLSASDVLVLPSIREGLPLVVLEALACGVPVVAADLPGLRQAAERLPDIRLAPVGASAEVFAARVVMAVREAAPAETVRARLIEGHFDLASSVAQWTNLCALER